MTADLVTRGNTLLEKGRWEEARQAFEEAMGTTESAEALAGSATASRWLDDIDAAITSMQRAYRAYVEGEASIDAANAAVWLAELFLDYRGEPAVASGWLQRARHRLKTEPDHPALVILAGMEAYLALAYDKDPPKARCLAEAALAPAQRLGDESVEIMAKAQLGLIRVSQEDMREGMRLLDEATAAAVAGELHRHGAVQTYCFLITACERVRDFERVAQWARHVVALATDMGREDFAVFARTQYANVLIWRGEWVEAEHELASLVEDTTNRPLTAAMALVQLSSLKRRQGNFEEADELLRHAEREPYRSGVRHLVLTARAALDLDRGDPQAAADMAERYLLAVSMDDPMERIEALEILVRARASLGEQEPAMRAAGELADIGAAISTDAVEGAARAASGVATRASGELDGARRAFEEAIALLDAGGAAHEVVRTRLELAETLILMGHPEAAGRDAEVAREGASRLGAAADVARAAHVLSGLREPPAGFEDLTSREVEILRLLAAGKSNSEMAEDLFVSVRTVERHVSNIYAKIGVCGRSGRVAAAAYAHTHGIT